MAIRSGGHSYPGWSAGDGALVVDVRPLHRVSLSGTTAKVGAGASLVQVYDALGTRGRAIAGGSCPTVGVAGLTQGGGVGVLTRAHGLTSDQVTSMRVVLADGRIVTASAQSEPDLFWALRGGGGGHLGVVTSFTFRTFAAPTITRAYVQWPFSAAAQVVPQFLRSVPHADRRLWATLKLLGGATHTSGPVLFMSATWTGPPSGMSAALAPLLSHVPAPTTDSRSTASYFDDAHLCRLRLDPRRPVPHRAGRVAASARRSRRPPTSSTTARADMPTLLHHVRAAQGSGLKEAGLSIDALGGAVDDVGAWRHRMGSPRRAGHGAVHRDVHLRPATPATSYVRGFRSAMTGSWGNGAYVNYADTSVPRYLSAYFGANASRLTQVRKAYDPHHFFTQPQEI